MSKQIPVNPTVLRWARETAGLKAEDVVKKLKLKRVTAKTVLAWENGEESPSYSQLERLAYDVYMRPLAIFFFPQPPVEETLKQSFRTLPEDEINNLIKPQLRFLIRKARVLQLNLPELFDDINPSHNQIIRDLSFKSNESVENMADEVRNYIEVDLSTQTKWKDNDEALKNWRYALEEHGIFIFKDDFRIDAFSGFCLYDEKFPIIYVNNNKSKTRQIFTLFHELAHLLFKTGGVDTRLDDYISKLSGEKRSVEILCNRFAGEFLVPSKDFEHQIHGLKIDEQTMEKSVEKLAYHYKVSREVILRKLYDRKQVEQDDYEKYVEKWGKTAAGSPQKGGNYYLTKGSYLGERYLEQAFKVFYQKKINVEQLADFLGEKVKNIPGMEAILFKKGVIV